MESLFAFTERVFVPIYQGGGGWTSRWFSVPGKTAPLVLGEADKRKWLRHIQNKGNFNMKWTFCSPTCETVPGLRDIRNSTEKRKDLEKVVAAVYIESHPPGVPSSVFPKASERIQNGRERSRESKPWHDWEPACAHNPVFRWGTMLRKIGVVSPCMGSSHLPVVWPHCCCPMFFPFSLLAHLLHSHVLLVLPYPDAFPLLSSNRPCNLQSSWIVKL